MRIVSSLLALVLLGGCALTEDQVAINYMPPPNLTVVNGASSVAVAVSGQDGRASNKDRISSKKNGYGMEMARIVAANDIVELVRAAVERELESLGFKIAATGLPVKVEVQTFYSDFKIGFWSGSAVAEVVFNLTASASDGALVYARSYKGIGISKNVMIASGSNAQPALQEALTNAMAQLIQDENLQKALVARRGSSSGAPVSQTPLARPEIRLGM